MATYKADYRYILKELGDTPSVWGLECYPETTQLPFISGTGCMYIEMKQGITEEEAKQIMDLLNKKVECISVVD